MGDFSILAADRAWDQVFPAEIIGLEVWGAAEASSDKVSVGEVTGTMYKGNPVSQKIGRGRKIQMGWTVEVELSVVATGTNMRTALANFCKTPQNSLFTMLGGATLKLLYTQFSWTVAEEGGQAFDGDEAAWKFKLAGTGTLLESEFNSAYTAAP